MKPALSRFALVHRNRGPRRLAGRLCPNPVVAAGGRFDAELGNGFAVVTMRTPGAVERVDVEQRGATVHVTAPNSELGRWLRKGRASAAIVRPDHTVMRAGRDPRPSSIAAVWSALDVLPNGLSGSHRVVGQLDFSIAQLSPGEAQVGLARRRVCAHAKRWCGVR